MEHENAENTNETPMAVIPPNKFDEFMKLVTKLNKKAAKAGVDPVRILKVEESTRKQRQGPFWEVNPHTLQAHQVTREVEVPVMEITLETPTFSIGDYVLVARVETLETGENTFHAVPAESSNIPERYADTGCQCEHCRAKRHRNETYLVRKGTQYKQVGSTCIRDFLGHDVRSAFAFCSDISGVLTGWGSDEMDEYYGMRSKRIFYVKRYLAWAQATIRTSGWCSRSFARESYGEAPTPTATIACNLYWAEYHNSLPKDFPKEERPNEADVEHVEAALAWIRSYTREQTKGNDYLNKLRAVASCDVCDASNDGVLASLLPAHQRFLVGEEKRKQRAKDAANSEHVGTVGKRETFKVVHVAAFALPDYGYGPSFINKFRDERGNVLVWKTGYQFDKGWEGSLKGTVKEHNEFRGEKQTVLTRCREQ